VDEQTAPEAAQPTLRTVKKNFGFVPNVMGVLAESPPAMESYLALNEKVQTTTLSPAEQQVAILTVSETNRCRYCVAAHTLTASGANVDGDAMPSAMAPRRTIPD